MRKTFTLYVPRDESLGITRGSAIVGHQEGDRVIVDFEGNVYDAINLRTYQGRLTSALDRHIAKYPTRSRSSVPLCAVIPVGAAYYELGIGAVISQIYLPEVLTGWLSPEPLPEIARL